MKRAIFLITTLFVLLFAKFAPAADPLIFLPFEWGSSWRCVQGPGGTFSHGKQPLYYAYDFNQHQSDAYNEPIYSPIEGTIVVVDNWVSDFVNNDDGNSENNNGWGNQVIIQDNNSGKFVRICHLKKDTVVGHEGWQVRIGDYLGLVGQTGFSTGPHVHVQVQNQAEYTDSIPFKFVEGSSFSCGGGYHGDWLTSINMENGSVLDNDGAYNLGHQFAEAEVWVHGDWKNSRYVPTFIGENYFFHYVKEGDNAKFVWQFRVKHTDFYNILISWTPYENRDRNASYSFRGKEIYVDQTEWSGFTDNNLYTISYNEFLYDDAIYTVTLEGHTPGAVAIADALFVQKVAY